jgi:hypothetical protein
MPSVSSRSNGHGTPPTPQMSSFQPNWYSGLLKELGASTKVIFQTRLTWMLLFGPAAVLANSIGFVSQTLAFALAGLALIPCAERYVIITATLEHLLPELYTHSCVMQPTPPTYPYIYYILYTIYYIQPLLCHGTSG